MTTLEINKNRGNLYAIGGHKVYELYPYEIWVFVDDDFAALVPLHRAMTDDDWYSTPDDCVAAIHTQSLDDLICIN